MSDVKRRAVTRSLAREDRFLAELLAGVGVGDAADRAGLSRSTGLRLRKSDDFQQRLRDARSQLLTSTIDKLRAIGPASVDVLAKIAGDEKQRGSDRVLSARSSIDLLLKGISTIDFHQRLAKLEEEAEKENR